MASKQVIADLPGVGDIVAGKYRIDRVLGKGGMGLVALAQHVSLGQQLAIKFLIADAEDIAVARFSREARASATLQSPHSARVHDVGQLENGTPYMVMEFLEGADLRDLVKQRGPLPVSEAVDYMLQICEGMAEAHATGIIHRDLKPANLFLAKTPDGGSIVKVLDFGISKVADGEQAELTATAMLMGTPHFMAPEQMRSARSADQRSDVYALGAILYHLLTAKNLYKAENVTELLVAALTTEPVPPSAFVTGIPNEVERTILDCLIKDPSKRVQNVADLALRIAGHGPPNAYASAKRSARMLGVEASKAGTATLRNALDSGRGDPSTRSPMSGLALKAHSQVLPPSPLSTPLPHETVAIPEAQIPEEPEGATVAVAAETAVSAATPALQAAPSSEIAPASLPSSTGMEMSATAAADRPRRTGLVAAIGAVVVVAGLAAGVLMRDAETTQDLSTPSSGATASTSQAAIAATTPTPAPSQALAPTASASVTASASAPKVLPAAGPVAAPAARPQPPAPVPVVPKPATDDPLDMDLK